MMCPKCHAEKTEVIDSVADGTAVYRKRRCNNCKYRFVTEETIKKDDIGIVGRLKEKKYGGKKNV